MSRTRNEYKAKPNELVRLWYLPLEVVLLQWGGMDLKGILREVRLMLLQLPAPRFWGIWLLVLIVILNS